MSLVQITMPGIRWIFLSCQFLVWTLSCISAICCGFPDISCCRGKHELPVFWCLYIMHHVKVYLLILIGPFMQAQESNLLAEKKVCCMSEQEHRDHFCVNLQNQSSHGWRRFFYLSTSSSGHGWLVQLYLNGSSGRIQNWLFASWASWFLDSYLAFLDNYLETS